MTVFLMAIAYGILKAGCFILLVVKGVSGLDIILEKL